MARLSPIQAAYLLGFRNAHAQIKRELDALVDEFRDAFDKLRDDVCSELHGLRADLARLRAIDNDDASIVEPIEPATDAA